MCQSSTPEPQGTLHGKHWITGIGSTELDCGLALNHPSSGVMDLFPIPYIPISLGDGTRRASTARRWYQLL